MRRKAPAGRCGATPFWAPAFAGALVVGCSAQSAIPPGQIVSNNPCIDAILAEVSAPGQIAAVSVWSHDPASASAPLDWARRLPALGTSAEEIIAARPRLVLTGNLASSGVNAALARAEVKTVAFGVPATLAETMDQVRAVAKAIGRKPAGEALVRKMQLSLLPSRLAEETGANQPSAIIWQAGGFVAGKGTIQDEMLARAGYRNASASYGLDQWGMLPLETLLRDPPDVIFTPVSGPGDEGRALAVRHRALRALEGRTRVIAFPDRLLFCGGPTVIEAMGVMKSRSPAVLSRSKDRFSFDQSLKEKRPFDRLRATDSGARVGG